MASKSMSQAAQAPVTQMPEGFRRVGSVANAGWFNMKKIGNILQGILEGMYQRKDDRNPKKVSNFFQVRLTGDCEVRMGRGEDATISVAHAGDYANLNYGPKTKDLENLIPTLHQGAVYEVYGIVAGDKIKLTGGRTMHNFDLGTKMIKAPQAIEDAEPDFGGSDQSDETA